MLTQQRGLLEDSLACEQQGVAQLEGALVNARKRRRIVIKEVRARAFVQLRRGLWEAESRGDQLFSECLEKECAVACLRAEKEEVRE